MILTIHARAVLNLAALIQPYAEGSMKCLPFRKKIPFNTNISGLLHLDDFRTPSAHLICTTAQNRNYRKTFYRER